MPWETRHFYGMLQECVSKSYWKEKVSKFRSCHSNFYFDFFILMTWNMTEKRELWLVFPGNQWRKTKNNFNFFAKRKTSSKEEIVPHAYGQNINFAKVFISGNVIQCNTFIFWDNVFIFWERIKNWFWRKYWKRELFSGAICYSAPNKPEAYLEPGRTSTVELFRKK